MIQWLGNVLIVIGLWKIGDRWRHAFLFSIAGEMAYIWASYRAENWALFSICIVFCGMAARSWVKWGQN